MKCSNCGYDAGSSKYCPNCGAKILSESEQINPNVNEAHKHQSKKRLIIIAAVAVIIAIPSIVLGTKYAHDKAVKADLQSRFGYGTVSEIYSHFSADVKDYPKATYGSPILDGTVGNFIKNFNDNHTSTGEKAIALYNSTNDTFSIHYAPNKDLNLDKNTDKIAMDYVSFAKSFMGVLEGADDVPSHTVTFALGQSGGPITYDRQNSLFSNGTLQNKELCNAIKTYYTSSIASIYPAANASTEG